jgi:hypothetical protein
LPRNRQVNVLDSIHDRCYPKILKKAISYHLITLVEANVSSIQKVGATNRPWSYFSLFVFDPLAGVFGMTPRLSIPLNKCYILNRRKIDRSCQVPERQGPKRRDGLETGLGHAKYSTEQHILRGGSRQAFDIIGPVFWKVGPY